MKLLLLILLFTAGTFSSFAQPANDNACGALTIPVESLGCEPSTVYSYVASTPSPGNAYCYGYQPNDVWYKFTAPSNGEVNFNVAINGSDYYMVAELYSSTSCSALTILNQFTNGFPCFYVNDYGATGGGRLIKNLTPGSTIYVRVYKAPYQTPDGSLKICVSNTNSFADEPCNAGFFPIEPADPLGQPCIPYKTISWTGATQTATVPNPSCMGNASFLRDVWFKVRVPANGRLNYRFENGESFGTTPYVAVYTTSACNSTFTELRCNFISYNLTDLVPNSILYFRIFRNSGFAQDYGIIKICVIEGNSVPTVDNNSKIGIGIDTPFAKLDVVGSGIFRDKLTAGSDVEVRGNLIVQGSIIGKYDQLAIQANSPSGVTSLAGAFNVDSFKMTNRLGNHISLFGGLGAVPQYGVGIQSGLLQIYSDGTASNIAFGSGNSLTFAERARIINQGEFGMSLKGRLQLQTGTQSAGLWLNNTANTASPAFIGMAADNLVGFYGSTGAAWGLTMSTTNANVGIGLNGTSPGRPLSFPASLGEKILLYPGGVGEVGIGVYGNELRFHADNPGAKVTFGTQDNSGNFDNTALAQRNGAYAFSVLGSLWVNGTTYASDERFKMNITAISSPLQKLLQLNGVEYEMRVDEFPKNYFQPGRQIGLLAQNVEKVIPEAVGEKDGYKGVDYARLVPLLIESIKELKKQNDDQLKRIEQLEKKLGKVD